MQALQRKTLSLFKRHALFTMESSDHFTSTSTTCDSLIPHNENTQSFTSFFSFCFDLQSSFYNMGVLDQFRFHSFLSAIVA